MKQKFEGEKKEGLPFMFGRISGRRTRKEGKNHGQQANKVVNKREEQNTSGRLETQLEDSMCIGTNVVSATKWGQSRERA